MKRTKPGINQPGYVPKTAICSICHREMPGSELNHEQSIHHGRAVSCFDRKDCERAKRKAARKAERR